MATWTNEYLSIPSATSNEVVSTGTPVDPTADEIAVLLNGVDDQRQVEILQTAKRIRRYIIDENLLSSAGSTFGVELPLSGLDTEFAPVVDVSNATAGTVSIFLGDNLAAAQLGSEIFTNAVEYALMKMQEDMKVL